MNIEQRRLSMTVNMANKIRHCLSCGSIVRLTSNKTRLQIEAQTIRQRIFQDILSVLVPDLTFHPIPTDKSYRLPSPTTLNMAPYITKGGGGQ